MVGSHGGPVGGLLKTEKYVNCVQSRMLYHQTVCIIIYSTSYMIYIIVCKTMSQQGTIR